MPRLLDECQGSFERLLSPPSLDALADCERAAAERSYKMHMLGNIKLVGGAAGARHAGGQGMAFQLVFELLEDSQVGIAILEELLSTPTPEAGMFRWPTWLLRPWSRWPRS